MQLFVFPSVCLKPELNLLILVLGSALNYLMVVTNITVDIFILSMSYNVCNQSSLQHIWVNGVFSFNGSKVSEGVAKLD